MDMKVLGIDLGKSVFHLIGMDAHGTIVLKKRYSRTQMFKFLANTPACLIGMEASCGCHHIGTSIRGRSWQLVSESDDTPRCDSVAG